RMAMSINLADGPQAGVVQIRNFALRNEPALSSIVSQGGEGADPTGRRRNLDASGDVGFDRMRANFVRTGGRFD
ncbi:hypothetical protein, partial [Enterobacter cloacae]